MNAISPKNGILPRQDIEGLIQAGVIRGCNSHEITSNEPSSAPQLQPASLDLSLGDTAYRLKASFLPGPDQTVERALKDVTVHKINLKDGAVLETGCVYLVPLRESLNLSDDLRALANPKSSTGRLDVFTRVICDGCHEFDAIPKQYSGPLYVEIAPRTFPILVKPGQRLVQMRFRRGPHAQLGTQMVSIDLKGAQKGAIIGYRARRHAGLVDMSAIARHNALDYWEPLRAPNERLILDPEEFYILASQEAISIPETQAAEMAPIAPEIGEFRAHYAGFFDPGFGIEAAGGAGSRAVLEVRGRDVPFLLRHGQPVAKLIFESMTLSPDQLYGAQGSNYQAQGLRLSKHFTH
ncbi:MAG: 2'-deoxycytidine 5'-triphosphate deaminase [Litorimonas sp.]